MTAAAGCVVRGDDPATLLLDAVGRATSPMGHVLDAVPGVRAVVLVVLSQPAPVNPALVERLVDLLHDAGAADVVVGGGLSTADRDRGHASVGALAATAGYRGRTPAGRPCPVVDLHDRLLLVDDASTPAVPSSSVLHQQRVSAVWAEADVRIVLCRNVSDAVDGYAGALDALLGVLPEVAGADPADVSADVLEHLPPSFAVADAVVSSHGPDGRHVLRELRTGALVAATDALRLDVTLALLQGEDPAASRPVQRALQRRSPASGPVVGDLTPFEGWVRAHPLVRDAARRAGSSPPVRRLLAAAVGGPDPGADAVADPALRGLRSLLAPVVAAADDPVVRGTLIGLLGTVAALAQQVDGWTTTTAKHRVPRVVVPLGFDPAAYGDEEYDGLPAHLAPLDDLLTGVPDVVDGMRWCLLDRAVVFETSRVVQAPFGAWVERVDVTEGISLMADYLGGRRVTVQADVDGRPVRQAERNLYLPQPNYLAHWGGEPIDVCKIELVERAAGRHALHWRTVLSPNGSATFDDGTLTFADVGDGRTRLSVRGRQLFALPPFWQAVDLDRVPEVKDDLVEDAYRRFFTTTFDNLEACYEGREFRIGSEPSDDGPLATRSVQLLLDVALQWLGEQGLGAGDGGPGRPRGRVVPTPEVDVHGFRHFRGGAT